MMGKNRNVQASILDRLIDEDPGNSSEPVTFSHKGKRQAVASVGRDLENLLNTRRHIHPPPKALKEVGNSLFVYGLPDFTNKNPATVSAQAQLRLEMEKTISRFEPRLKNISVQVDTPAGSFRDIRFRISGLLVLESLTEPVIFDTSYDSNRGKYKIIE